MLNQVAFGVLISVASCVAIVAVPSGDKKNTVAAEPLSNSDRVIHLEILVNAPVERVWRAWTTREGVISFFSRDCDIDFKVLGKYEMFFRPNAPTGSRGGEGNTILAIEENKMLAFTWNSPPEYPTVRNQRTSVVVRFHGIEQNKTKVTLVHSGWGENEEWHKVYTYFQNAWGAIVLPRLKYSLEVGPIDWTNPPANLKKAVSLE